jgi:hypothetical protein
MARFLLLLVAAFLAVPAAGGAQTTCVWCSAQEVLPPHPHPWVIHIGGCCAPGSESPDPEWRCVQWGHEDCPYEWGYAEDDVCQLASACRGDIEMIALELADALDERDLPAIARAIVSSAGGVVMNYTRNSLQIIDCRGGIAVNLAIVDASFAHGMREFLVQQQLQLHGELQFRGSNPRRARSPVVASAAL